MKSKLFRILGVVAVVAMIAASLVAPVSATVSAVTATVATTNNPTLPANQISAAGNYSIYATLATQLLGTSSYTVTLPDKGDAVTFTEAATTDIVKVTTTGAAPTVTLTGTGAYASGVVSFAAAADAVKFTSTADATTLTYTITVGSPTVTTIDLSGAPTCAAAPGAFTMPDVGDPIVFTAAAGTDTVTLTSTALANLSVVFAPVGTATYAAGLITFSAAAQTATVTSTVSQVTGTWARTGTPAGAAGTNVAAAVTTGAGVANGDSITVTFPSTFTVTGASSATDSIAASQGWVAIPPATIPTGSVTAVLTSTAWSFSGTANTVTYTLKAGDKIGANAQVLINITAGVANPATAGSYAVTVATSAETTAVTSSTFAIVNPIIPTVSGIATVFNSAGIQMTQSNDLGAMLAYVQTNTLTGAVIKLTAGTYSGPTAFGATSVSCTILGTDANAANVILKSSAPWSLTGPVVLVNLVTIDASSGGLLTMGGGATTSANVSSSYLKGGVLTMAASGTSATNTVYGDTFTVATGKVGLNSSVVTTVTGSTFNVAGTGIGITGAAKETISGSTFIGVAASSNNGVGIVLSAGTGSTITTSIFTGLNSALVVSGAAVSFNGNTVTSCGLTAGPDAIMINSTTGTGVFILNNKITGSLEYIATINANDNLVFIMDNNFATNVKNVNNVVSANKLNATHNFWGAGVTAPTSTAAPNWVDYSNSLGSVPTSSTFAVAATLDATATAGVNVTASNGTIVGAAALTGNPVTPTIASTNTVVKYFDVFGTGATTATIDFYGTTASPVTANSQILFFNTTFGTWQACSAQTINIYGNYVEVTIGAGTAPTAAQFNGLPFALVTAPTAPPAAIGTPTYPGNGATSVPVNAANLTFTWPAVAGAGISYQFALAQASANTTANEFAILDYSDNTITNAEPLQETLQYNTVYWWEVRAVTTNSSGGIATSGPWTVSMFTTAAAPVTTTGTAATNTTIVTSVVITNPVTTVVSTSTNIVIGTGTGTSSPAIPSYLLWAVIAVGAVLIIAVIVLIVRTRRIP